MTASPAREFDSVATATRDWAHARGLECLFIDETGSTNDDAKAAVDPPAEWLVLTAHQRAGRGRGTNAWSDVGRGAILLSSWVFHPAHAPSAITAPRVGLGLHAAASRAWPGLAWGLKAPNDLYLEDRKVAGLLIEVTSIGDRHRLIVGLGLNVLARPRLDTATSLSEHLGRALTYDEWDLFADAWLGELRAILDAVTRPALDPAARRDLRRALNARPNRAFEVTEVTPAGDLVHASGVVRWTEL